MEVRIFRGFGGKIFSTGMDRLHEKIQTECKHLNSTIIDGYDNWNKHVQHIKTINHPVVLIGHSFGALASYKIVSELNSVDFPLVVSFDYSPYYSGIVDHKPNGVVPANVHSAINFYQEVDPIVRGIKMKREDGSDYQIANIEGKCAHVEIDKVDVFHKNVIKAIRNIYGI